MFSKGKYILLQTVLMLVSPLSSLFVSLKFYKSTLSQIFMVVFAMYFGYYFGFISDLMRHYDNMMMYYYHRDVSAILSDPRIFLMGGEYFHVIFKLLISRFTSSMQVFGACACGVYATAFLFFFRQFSQFYKKPMSLLNGILLLCVVFVVEFYWYQGLRFWTGVFVFMGFYMKFVNTRRWKYLVFSCSCAFFHMIVGILPIAVLLSYLLGFTGKVGRYTIFGLSLVVRSLNIDFVPIMLKYFPWTASWGIAVSDSRIRLSVRRRMENIREYGNIFYNHRSELLVLFGLLALVIMFRNRVRIDKKYGVLFYMFLTLFTIANFGYGDLIFYDRILKAAALMLYSYLFIVSCVYNSQIINGRLLLLLLLMIPLLYAIATPFVEQRAYLYHIELFFGSIFENWNGNELNIDYGWRHY